MPVDASCPVCRTADIVCGKWTLLLVRELEEEGIVERSTYPAVPPRVEYALTEKGRALIPIIEDMRTYGERWLGASCATEPPRDDEADAPETAAALAARARSARIFCP